MHSLYGYTISLLYFYYFLGIGKCLARKNHYDILSKNKSGSVFYACIGNIRVESFHEIPADTAEAGKYCFVPCDDWHFSVLL